jgi:hypothetical protein
MLIADGYNSCQLLETISGASVSLRCLDASGFLLSHEWLCLRRGCLMLRPIEQHLQVVCCATAMPGRTASFL